MSRVVMRPTENGTFSRTVDLVHVTKPRPFQRVSPARFHEAGTQKVKPGAATCFHDSRLLAGATSHAVESAAPSAAAVRVGEGTLVAGVEADAHAVSRTAANTRMARVIGGSVVIGRRWARTAGVLHPARAVSGSAAIARVLRGGCGVGLERATHVLKAELAMRSDRQLRQVRGSTGFWVRSLTQWWRSCAVYHMGWPYSRYCAD